MVRGGRAEAPVPRSDVSFRLDQKTANFKEALGSRPVQWSQTTEQKQKNEFEQNYDDNKGRQLPVGVRVHTSVALQQKTGNFKVAFASRNMKRSVLT
jgi:hypothetical protein